MAILEIILLLSFGVYILTTLIYTIGQLFPVKGRNKKFNRLSVVIAMKNEASNLPGLLKDLDEQDYPEEFHEIIFVDNESSDESVSIVRKFISDKPRFRLLSTEGVRSQYSHKKAALDCGINQAQGEIIVTTDADCHMERSWLSAINSYFEDDVDIVVGFSEIADHSSLFTKLQSLDYLMLMGAAQGTLNLGAAWACSGQNLAYRKSLFRKVGGFKKVVDRIGGDDSLLLQVMKRQTKNRILFASDSRAWVQTVAEPSLKRFISQRARWASEAEYSHKLDIKFFIIVIVTFLANLTPLYFGISTLLSGSHFIQLIGTLLIKFTGEGLLALQSTRSYNRHKLIKVYPLWFVLQMPYILLMGLLSFVGNLLPWKGQPGKRR